MSDIIWYVEQWDIKCAQRQPPETQKTSFRPKTVYPAAPSKGLSIGLISTGDKQKDFSVNNVGVAYKPI